MREDAGSTGGPLLIASIVPAPIRSDLAVKLSLGGFLLGLVGLGTVAGGLYFQGLVEGAAAGAFVGVGAVLVGGFGWFVGRSVSSDIEELSAAAERIEDGDLEAPIETDRSDSIGELYRVLARMRETIRAQVEQSKRARKQAEVSRSEALEMNSYFEDRSQEYADIMQATSRGDLTQRMETEDEHEAMDRIADAFNEMLGEIEMTTGQLKTFAEEVEDSGDAVKASAETVRDASEQVADSIQKISDDAYDQKERLRRISEAVDEVVETLERIAHEHPEVDMEDSLDRLDDVAGMVEETAELGEETMAESENVAGAAEEQAAELSEVSARAEELTRYAQYLGDGLNNFETEREHEFVFQTGAEEPGPSGGATVDDAGADR